MCEVGRGVSPTPESKLFSSFVYHVFGITKQVKTITGLKTMIFVYTRLNRAQCCNDHELIASLTWSPDHFDILNLISIYSNFQLIKLITLCTISGYWLQMFLILYFVINYIGGFLELQITPKNGLHYHENTLAIAFYLVCLHSLET